MKRKRRKVVEITNDAFKIVLSFETSDVLLDIDKKRINFKINNKTIFLKSTNKNELISETKFLTIVIRNYSSYKEASIDMIMLDQAIKLAALKENIGVLTEVNSHEQQVISHIQDSIFKEQFHMKIVPKRIHGKGIFFNNAPDFDPDPNIEKERIKEFEFIDSLSYHFTNYEIAFELLEAIEILNSIKIEYSSKSRIILSMTVIEMLAGENALKSEEEVAMIEKLEQVIENSSLNNNKKESLKNSLILCKKDSIGKTCRKLVKEHLGRKESEEFYKLYNYRSEVVHTGKTNNNSDVDNKLKEFDYAELSYNLAYRLLLSLLEKYKYN